MPRLQRIEAGVTRPSTIEIQVNGQPISCYPGETVASALIAAGRLAFRRTASGALRGPVCNMGVCFECLVQIGGQSSVRGCLVKVSEGMCVTIVDPHHD